MAHRLHSGRRIGLAAGVLAVSWLGVVFSMDHARAGQDRVVRSQDVPVTSGTSAVVPSGDGPKVSAKISDLLAQVEQQIASGRMWSPPDDNAIDTFRSIIDLLPDATTSDLRAMQGLPSRFEAQAHAAEAAGRHEEAQRFLIWAQAFATLPGIPADQSSRAAQPGTTNGEADASSAGGASGTDVPRALIGSAEPPALPPASSAPVAGMATEGRAQPAPIAAASLLRPPNPAGLPSAKRSVEPAQSPDTVALLLRRGEVMQRLGDISAARLLYRRAALAGSAQAATAMGKMFDPIYLAEIGTRGVAPDSGAAASWYRRAIALGDQDAESRLQELGQEPILAGSHLPSPPSAPPAARAARAPLVPTERKITRAVSEHCRAIILKVQLGAEPSDAERAYLRQGCQHG